MAGEQMYNLASDSPLSMIWHLHITGKLTTPWLCATLKAFPSIQQPARLLRPTATTMTAIALCLSWPQAISAVLVTKAASPPLPHLLQWTTHWKSSLSINSKLGIGLIWPLDWNPSLPTIQWPLPRLVLSTRLGLSTLAVMPLLLLTKTRHCTGLCKALIIETSKSIVVILSLRFSNQPFASLRYAQFIVGFHFEQGIIVPKDLSMAKKYYLSSAQQNSPDAQAALGILLVDEQQYDNGLKWLHDAAKSVSKRR